MGSWPREIDWNRIWLEARKQRTCKGKGQDDWDRKAASFARRNRGSSYIARLLSFIRAEPTDRILDVGCGPGTLAIPLAAQVAQVTAMDYSSGMLAALVEQAQAESIDNITVCRAAWEDDWEALALPSHDIAVASRSLSVDDLAAALKKLDRWAIKRVVVTDRVGSGPFDPEVFAAVGRQLDAGPDYMITVNLLHQLGIYAKVDFIDAEYSESYGSREDAFDSVVWMLDDLHPAERLRLEHFLDERLTLQGDGRWHLSRRHTPRWAVIWWDK
ncbi:MAG: class I SAM-dependent methyltransferase [Proteobacteria bacterium]|nr:class I SAM-dependent methyltransferase [Pseudomonadota bacterium]MBU1687922.1 class I SAM-dependent methyltransferase [Pseudomonadota bacterium]